MSLRNVLHPRSVAIIGASRTETKRGYQAINTLLTEKYEGQIYPVNPKEKNILGLTCYPSIEAVPAPVDMALIALPAKAVPAILEACGRKGVRGAVILAAGFGEIGTDGRRLEDQLVANANAYDLRFVGPNTSGMINPHANFNLTGLQDVPKGHIGLLTQSGNMALTLITEAKLKSRLGFSLYIGVGNEADIKFHEYIGFFREDPNTRAILMYVEGLRQGRDFLQHAYRTTPKKPIVLLKSGRSSTGKRSAGSHTGALAGLSEVAKGAFERAGIVVIENSDELFPAVESLSSLPPLKNGRIAILADGGGHATIAADTLTDLGVGLPLLQNKTQSRLKEILPATASVVNPVDVAGGADADPAVLADCARIILRDKNIGGLLIVGLFGGYGIRFAKKLAFIEEDAAHRLGHLLKESGKPIIIHSLYSHAKPHALELCRYYQIPVYDSLDIACKCIGVLHQYGAYQQAYHLKANFNLDYGAKAKAAGNQIIAGALAEKRSVLLEHEAKRLLQIHGAPGGNDILAQTASEAVAAAGASGGKVALKIVSPDILHKSDSGGVQLNLEGDRSVAKAYETIQKSARRKHPQADIRGVLVAPMAPPGLEVIIGTKYDDQFGPVIMFGLGGIFVEVLKDVVFRVLPISPAAARRMIGETRAARLLDGYRGQPAVDQKSLQRLLCLCAEVMEAYPTIREMDLNPVIVTSQGLHIVDARVILQAAPTSAK